MLDAGEYDRIEEDESLIKSIDEEILKITSGRKESSDKNMKSIR